MATSADFEDATIPDVLTVAASTSPAKQALRMLDGQLSYDDLHRLSNRIARALKNAGVGRGDRVGLLSHKSLELVASVYGVLKSGAAYVPINPEAPASLVARIIEDCAIGHLVSDDRQVKRLRDLDLGSMSGIGWEGPNALTWADVAQLSDSAVSVDLDPGDLAYILYTSGSTGQPKGIMHSHRSALAFAATAAEIYELNSDDVLTNHAPLHFDLSTFDLFSSACAAATTVIVPLAHSRLPASLSQLLDSEAVTVLYSVPYAQIQLLHNGALAERDLSALRWVVFAGEAFPTGDLRALMTALPQARFSNIYGPTETNGCTFYHVDELPTDDSQFIPIGTPLPHTEIEVVDGADQPVPDGQVGELLVHGPTQMLGYWNKPDLNERSTLVRPAEGGGEKRFYRTGDLVTRRSNGVLTLTGRRDRQIKTRGYRVELDEIEAALLSHESVREAAVFAVPDSHGSSQIEAVFTSHQPLVGASDLNAYLNGLLPRYAVPSSLKRLHAMPRTSTGKIDRMAIESLSADRGGEPT